MGFLVHVKLCCLYFDPSAAPVSMNQVTNLTVINITNKVKISFIGSVQETHLPVSEDFTCKSHSINHDKA